MDDTDAAVPSASADVCAMCGGEEEPRETTVQMLIGEPVTVPASDHEMVSSILAKVLERGNVTQPIEEFSLLLRDLSLGVTHTLDNDRRLCEYLFCDQLLLLLGLSRAVKPVFGAAWLAHGVTLSPMPKFKHTCGGVDENPRVLVCDELVDAEKTTVSVRCDMRQLDSPCLGPHAPSIANTSGPRARLHVHKVTQNSHMTRTTRPCIDGNEMQVVSFKAAPESEYVCFYCTDQGSGVAWRFKTM